MSPLAKAAAWYAATLAWPVFPVVPSSKVPAVRAWPDKATTDQRQIGQWFASLPFNIGLLCGPGSMFVIDVDQHGTDGEESLAKAEKRLGKLPPTAEQVTGSGGRQLFYTYPPDRDLRNSASRLGKGLDSRGWHGYVLLPPSLHPCGEPYRWKHWPHKVPIASLPTRWIDKLERTKAPTIPVPVQPVGSIGHDIVDRLLNQLARLPTTPSNRHSTLYAVACDLFEKQAAGIVPRSNYDDLLLAAAMTRGLDHKEATNTIRDAHRARG